MDEWLSKFFLRAVELRERSGLGEGRTAFSLLVFAFVMIQFSMGWYWGREVPGFEVTPEISATSGMDGLMVSSLVRIGSRLTDKPGGYLSNDLMPPGVLLDNVPAWEKGVLDQARGLVHVMYKGGGPNAVDIDLAEAEAGLAVQNEAWAMPSAEGEIMRATQALKHYGQSRGAHPSLDATQLQGWLKVSSERLEYISAKLNAALPAYAAGSAGVLPEGLNQLPGTSWWHIDDVLYEARGSAWALLHLLKAAEIEFEPLLTSRHADLSLRAAIHELEAAQQPIWSPLVLNGSGFGLFANHSLIMANYLGRARAGLEDVQLLLRATQ